MLLSAFALIPIIFSSCVAEVITPIQEVSFQKEQRVDTIIIFDPVTFEETQQLIVIDNQVVKETIEGEVQVDTIITFDPETFEETIQIVRTKVTKDKTDNN